MSRLLSLFALLALAACTRDDPQHPNLLVGTWEDRDTATFSAVDTIVRIHRIVLRRDGALLGVTAFIGHDSTGTWSKERDADTLRATWRFRHDSTTGVAALCFGPDGIGSEECDAVEVVADTLRVGDQSRSTFYRATR